MKHPFIKHLSVTLHHVLGLLACVLILKVTAGVLLSYRDYLPPNFETDFLRGRQDYFGGSYQWAFYTHLVSGPCSLILGMIVLSERIRRRHPIQHRRLGRIQAMCVLLLVVPSGLWMAFRAQTGAVAGTGFAMLGLATGVSVVCGWKSAVRNQFAKHQLWMRRCFLLLCSAVVLRVMGGLATVMGMEGQWIYPASAWTCWLLPLGVFELVMAVNRGEDKHSVQ